MKPLDVIIENAEKILLTANDILHLTNNEVNILVYDDLVKYKTIDQVFGDKNAIVLLYQNTENSGHWVLLTKLSPKILYWFDSYGFQLDQEIKWSSYLLNKGYLNNPPLTYLIKNSPYKLLQNKIKYQQLSNAVNTCGRWCIVRYNYRHLKDKDFQTFILKSKHYSGDFWVSILTM